MNAEEPVIRIRGLRNQFGEQVVHENLDLDVRRGEIIGVVGGSGSGKSVLLRSIIGLGHPAAGSIRLFGEEVATMSDAKRGMIERRCGVLFQNGALFSSLSVAENVAVALTEHHDIDPGIVHRLALLKIALAGLPLDAADKFPAQLSGGMVKRAALARSLALDPDILFLDEPTAGLDPIGAAAFDQLILTLRDSLGLTVFLITHDLDTLYTICDRVAVLAKKRILVADSLDVVEKFDEPWVQDYFQGPRGRAAQRAAASSSISQPQGH
ncbi:MAG: ATP-binding cassette domain-containing protein [Dokdonella sp.]|nr:ATP-binding cassette domain-containing protein [Dokdonella sp.]MCB1573087.1 ATP-binding cassette domain-containing protein [Xanthomonadales bacterium]MCB1577941.1 ATP-binding cassette domain-containing protein [Xanthomonadales bacterium]